VDFRSEIWRTAEVFGAACRTSLSNQVTHVVAAKVHCSSHIWSYLTVRTPRIPDAARRRGGIHIVWLAWFLDSLALWRQQDEIDADADAGSTP